MKTFSFNGTSSETLGLVILDMPPVAAAEKSIESIKVEGRNGNLHIDNGTYDSRDYTIECVVLDMTKMDLIKSTLQGIGTFTLSTVPNRVFDAVVTNQVDFKTYASVLGSFPLKLELSPFSKSSTVTTNTLTASGNITVTGTTDVAPVLVITGVGEVTVNGTTIEVLESGITIDCDLMTAYNGATNKSSQVIIDEFPKLKVGSNTITLGTGVTQVVINHYARWM